MPAYTRLDVDARRAQLLALGQELFTRHAYDELSMSRIAREAGISKALLYHYFPSKQAYFSATLQAAAAELEAILAPSADLPPAQQLERALDAFLDWVQANAAAYAKLFRSVQAAAEVRELVGGVRDETARRILDALVSAGQSPPPLPPPALRAAVRGWLWFMDGVCLDWIEHRDLDRDRVKGLLLGTLLGALTASGEGDAAIARLTSPAA